MASRSHGVLGGIGSHFGSRRAGGGGGIVPGAAVAARRAFLWGGRWALGGGRWRCECLVSVTRMALRVVFVACLMSPGRTIVILLVAEI